MMNQGNISSKHLTLSGSSSSSKTVAAILKQAKDHQASSEGARAQQQAQTVKKKSRHGNEPNQQSSNILNQLNMSKGSPQNRVGSPSVVASPHMSPSSNRGVSPLGKEHSHPVTTKSSSLGRDISPSLITAQIVKVMAEPATTTAPNLLRSALQGNMPDPMGILSSSKTEGGFVTVVTSTPGCLTDYTSSNRKSPLNISSLSPNSNSVSGSHHQGHAFSKILTSIAGAGGYLGQPEVDHIDSLMTASTVENLLASSDGAIQTVNVSHIPKSMNPNSTNIGALSGNASSTPCTSSRTAQRIAMEVAQQIKIEANGQKSNAQLAALRPGMQQQLRTQIQSSRSIDAQFVPKPVSFTNQSTSVKTSHKDTEHKTLEASMPLLASKLTTSVVPTSMTKLAASSLPSHLQQQQQHQQQMTSESFVFQLSSVTSASSSIPSPSSTTLARRTGQINSPGKPQTEAQQQQQQNVVRHLQQGKQAQAEVGTTNDSSWLLQPQQGQAEVGTTSDTSWMLQPQQGQAEVGTTSDTSWMLQPALQQGKQGQAEVGTTSDTSWMLQPALQQGKQGQAEVGTSNDSSWMLQPALQQVQTDTVSPAVRQNELRSGIDKQHPLDRLFQQNNMNDSKAETPFQTDIPVKTESSHSQTIAKHLSSQHGYQRSGSVSSMSSFQAMLAAKISPSHSKTTVSGSSRSLASHRDGSTPILSSSSHHTSSKYRPGESKQTAIDVDLDIGQLASITGDGMSMQTDLSSLHTTTKDIKHIGQHSSIDHQFNKNTSVTEVPTPEQTTAKSRDSPACLPSQTVKTTSLFTIHSLTSSSALAHIPKPIVHPHTASTSSSSSSAASTTLPPPPDYIPPPPYPSKLGQQYLPQQQQQQGFSNRSGQATKHSIQNPFTFPTTGVKVHADPNSHGLSYSFISQHSSTSGADDIKQALYGHFKDPKKEMDTFSKSYSDTSVASSRQRRASQGMQDDILFEMPDVKLEVNEDNHLDEGNTGEKRPMIQPFNQRVSNLSCFPVMNSTYRASYRSHAVAVQRARSGVITNTAKSLDILRQNLQRSINKEISDIIKRYTDKYFQPALENIKQNNSENFLGEEHINYVCRQILEEAKGEYMSDSGRRSVTPSDIPDNVSETGSLGGRRVFLKRCRVSDSDSEKGSDGGFKRKVAKKKGRPIFQGSGRVTPSKTYKSGESVKREGPKWDPERLKTDTLFVMGARANKALGLGNTRGRLYIRHPDVFKYIGDQEDKLWLCEHNLMPPTGGKAYMLLLEDIEDLSRSDEYKDSQGLMMHECVGFTVPEWMLVKIKDQMNLLRSDSTKRGLSRSPVSEYGEIPHPKIMPFSAFTDPSVKEETMVSPADTEEMDFLSAADNDGRRPPSDISPFTVTGGYEGGVSPSPSELDPIEDPPPVSSLFS